MENHIVIVLAVFRPDIGHFRAQLASLNAQEHGNFSVLFVAADTTSQELIARSAKQAGLTHRIATPPAPLDAPRAFEFGLACALEEFPETTFFALCDQDDIWHPNRLSRGLAALANGADLAHSDARIVAADGAVLHKSLFRFEHRRRAPGLRGLLYRNNVTGMTVLATRRTIAAALPFPAQDGVHFYHDLWLALVATVLSKPVFINHPLVDYRQHAGNAVGARHRKHTRLRWPGRATLRTLAAQYALAMYLARCLVLRLGQEPAHLARLRPLRPFLSRLTFAPWFALDAAGLALTGHPGLAARALGYATVAIGRSVWALRHAATLGLSAALGAFDTRVYALSPGQPPAPAPIEPAVAPTDWTSFRDSRTLLRWQPAFSAPGPGISILVPTLNPTEIFAGVVTALDVGLGLADRGHTVRFIATDLPIASVAASRAFLLHRHGGQDIAARISLHCGVRANKVPCHRDDFFLATAWWTAHVAQSLLKSGPFSQQKFLYLIQDFEPGFYPWGAEYAQALESYSFNFTPIFNTATLRDHFAGQGFGFADPAQFTIRPSMDLARYTALPNLRQPGKKRIALYGRPEVPRNMFPMAIEALGMFLSEKSLKPAEVSLVSVGLQHGDIRLPGGHVLRSKGKLPWSDYPKFLASVDIGLSLMLSPHPSHLPLEMAAAGATVVTNSFGSKDLSHLSPAILSCSPNASALANTLAQAWASPLPDANARAVDLPALGAPIDKMLDHLSARIDNLHRQERRCA